MIGKAKSQALLDAIQPFAHAAALGWQVMDAVKQANVQDKGLTKLIAFDAYAGQYMAESHISWSNWHALLDAWVDLMPADGSKPPAGGVGSPQADMGAIAIDMVIASLSPAQVQLLKELRPNGDGWTYPVKVRGDGLQSCMALVKRGIVSGDNPRPFQNRGRGFIRLTPFGEGLRDIIVGRAA